MDFKYDEFLICTVREATEDEKTELANYVQSQEAKGKRIYYPARDTHQVDETGGYRICCDNNRGMRSSRSISVYWTEKSQGTKFDLGEAFDQHVNEGKNISLVNRSLVEKIVADQRAKGTAKSFEMVLLRLDDLAKQ